MTKNFKGQHAAVLGLGRSGEAAARLLLECGAAVTVLDSGEPAPRRKAAALLSSRGARVVLGGDALRCVQDFDFAVLSPGIDPSVPLVQRPMEAGVPILGEIELAFRQCHCPVVAITGTNGKTTTTGLTAAVLNAAGLRAEACGNIGVPFSDVAARSASLDVAVVEISSFQLESTDTFHPRVAVWTNFSANHLDRYPDVEAYRAAKLRIFERQTADDFAVVNARNGLPRLEARRIKFTASPELEADFTLGSHGMIAHRGHPLLAMSSTHLRGPHNAENIMAAFAVGFCLGADAAGMIPGVKKFLSPPHRCEFVREVDGVTWINDSKSTNLDALTQAILGQSGRVILIAGGKNKGFDFAPLTALVKERVQEAVLMGEMRDVIAHDWERVIPCYSVSSLEQAVHKARALARPGDTVLFSPGTSSFDMFKSYEERGELFKQFTHQITTIKPTTNYKNLISMKIPLFTKMAGRSRSRKIVRASAAQATRADESEYFEAEPNTKLSHAFMVVLVLHIVAVGGIYAFNKINASKKALQAPAVVEKTSAAVPEVVAAAKPVPAQPQRMPGDADEPLPAMGGSLMAATTAATKTVTQPAAAKLAPVAAKEPAATKVVTKAETVPAGATPATYKVVKGDNPYSIAKKLGVSQDELLKANAIEDPRKLQIGQVLKIPAKTH